MWGRRHRKVLIVEAPESKTGLHAAFLEQPDIRLMTTEPGDGARALARVEHPRLIIQDVSDPHEASLALTRALKRDGATGSIPIIAVAGPASEKLVWDSGADAVLLKPVIQRAYWEAVRRFIRLPKRRDLRQIVNLRFIYEDGERRWQAFSRDLSTYGAFLKTDHAPPQGARLRVRFSIPGEAEPVTCGAIVRRSTPFDPHNHHAAGFAVEFEALSAGDAERLERFVRRHLRRSLFSLIAS